MSPSNGVHAAFGWLRAPIPSPALPEPEPTGRRLVIRSIATLALVASAVYLTWRLTSTLDLTVWWVSIPLVVLEIHAALGLALFTFSLWDVDRRPPHRDVAETPYRIAVLVPTYNESIEILLPTVAAAAAIRLPHETWVLDDGNRPEVEKLAADLGVRYLTRREHVHAKAGNLNHALDIIDADLIAVLDADHVAEPDLLVRTVGYFDDPGIALVQTPQEFYNRQSFEHEAVAGDGERFHEQALFYRMLEPGKNRWGGAFWCGTGAVVRVSALADIGGVATDTITEDIHTTIRLHRHGWRSVYHNEVLARGLAAGDADTYQLQRLRWGTGAMQVLRHENPLVVPGLTLPQRLTYAATLLGWFDAWRTLGFAILPMVVVVTGAVPIRADLATFVVAFVVTFLLQQLAMLALSRGCHRPILSIVFELVRMTSNLRATSTLVAGRRPTFAVTPKGRQGDGRHRVRVPLPLRALLIASFLASAWFALTVMGRTPVQYTVPGAALAAFGWLLVNAFLVALAIDRIRALRYAPERRGSVRFDVVLELTMGELAAETRDLSTTGARVITGVETPPGTVVPVRVAVDGEVVELSAIVRSVTRLPTGGIVHGLEFMPDQHEAQARLSLALFAMQRGSRIDWTTLEPKPEIATRRVREIAGAAA
jgi:cellulose synthase/poly-beta-1,6-N-acetylglucosamine synthase-like glycosyltransferase